MYLFKLVIFLRDVTTSLTDSMT